MFWHRHVRRVGAAVRGCSPGRPRACSASRPLPGVGARQTPPSCPAGPLGAEPHHAGVAGGGVPGGPLGLGVLGFN